MRAVPFDERFALWSAAQLPAPDLARLREWIAGIAHPAECIALIEDARVRAALDLASTGAARRAVCNVFVVSAAGTAITR